MTLEVIRIGPKGGASMYYRDGGLFLGHTIIVRLDEDRRFADADIAG